MSPLERHQTLLRVEERLTADDFHNQPEKIAEQIADVFNLIEHVFILLERIAGKRGYGDSD